LSSKEATSRAGGLEKKLLHHKIHEVTDWKEVLGSKFDNEDGHEQVQIGNWLNLMLGNAV
jgi:hypothetical protein